MSNRETFRDICKNPSRLGVNPRMFLSFPTHLSPLETCEMERTSARLGKHALISTCIIQRMKSRREILPNSLPVTVAPFNYGDLPESLNITAYANGTQLGKETSFALAAKNSSAAATHLEHYWVSDGALQHKCHRFTTR
jgi:hypothetical protein